MKKNKLIEITEIARETKKDDFFFYHPLALLGWRLWLREGARIGSGSGGIRSLAA